MRTLIQGGWVVGFDGSGHELLRDGVVVYEDDRIAHVGHRFDGRVDRTIDAAGMLVMPGLVNCHLHLGSNSTHTFFLDDLRADFFGSNFYAYAVGRAVRATRGSTTVRRRSSSTGSGRRSAAGRRRCSTSGRGTRRRWHDCRGDRRAGLHRAGLQVVHLRLRRAGADAVGPGRKVGERGLAAGAGVCAGARRIVQRQDSVHALPGPARHLLGGAAEGGAAGGERVWAATVGARGDEHDRIPAGDARAPPDAARAAGTRSGSSGRTCCSATASFHATTPGRTTRTPTT